MWGRLVGESALLHLLRLELSSGTISTSVITKVHHPSSGQPADSQRSARGSGCQSSINSQAYKLTRLLFLIHGPPPSPEAPARCPGAQRGGRLCRAGQDQCEHQALVTQSKAHLGPEVEPESRSCEPEQDHACPRGPGPRGLEGLVHFSARCGRNTPRATGLLGADTGSPHSLLGWPHCPRGRRKVPAFCLGTTGTQQGAVCCRDPR